jgi:hypothetical protein
MKKQLLSTVAAFAVLGAGAASAQAPTSPPHPEAAYQPHLGYVVPAPSYDGYFGRPRFSDILRERVLQEQYGVPYAYGLPHYPHEQRRIYSRRDRDGDGVANHRDRYPADPRYR